MYRIATWTACFAAFLISGFVQTETRFSIRAASAEPVEDWEAMQVEHSSRTVWVSPIAAVVASDIESAQPETRNDGDRVIKVSFTEAGANKMRDLTTAQFKKLVVLVVDGRVIWAPYVQAVIGRESVLTGNQKGGLTEDEVNRILSSLHQVN